VDNGTQVKGVVASASSRTVIGPGASRITARSDHFIPFRKNILKIFGGFVGGLSFQDAFSPHKRGAGGAAATRKAGDCAPALIRLPTRSRVIFALTEPHNLFERGQRVVGITAAVRIPRNCNLAHGQGAWSRPGCGGHDRGEILVVVPRLFPLLD
jgi:hypothetical protein